MTVMVYALAQALKERTRIYVPDSVLLLGVMDEMNVLDSGEVFLRIDPSTGSNTSPVIITGPVIMARNPCFHPGDIRKLQVCSAPTRTPGRRLDMRAEQHSSLAGTHERTLLDEHPGGFKLSSIPADSLGKPIAFTNISAV